MRLPLVVSKKELSLPLQNADVAQLARAADL